ncbi:MAG: retropepsin-like aspartic protease, partial [Phycisphaerales bacterium]|nr:retropepsin-like aspartic protease [Phycisphaerales bacterium]
RQRRLLASRKTSAAEMLKKFDLERPDVRVALETLDQSPFLTATCEDHSLKLMLDTGATMTTLFAKSWNRVSIEYANPPPPQGMAWGVTGESPVQGGRLRELSVGPLRLLDVPVAVTGVEAAAARRGSSSVPFDGVLGMNVLSRFLVVIDGPEGVLYLAEYASTAE